MYSESDIEGAVAAGAMSPEAARALRDHVATLRSAPAVDEESFRLLTGFNDIFVSIAVILTLVAIGWIGGSISAYLPGFAVAAASWGLAEYFTRAAADGAAVDRPADQLRRRGRGRPERHRGRQSRGAREASSRASATANMRRSRSPAAIAAVIAAAHRGGGLGPLAPVHGADHRRRGCGRGRRRRRCR